MPTEPYGQGARALAFCVLLVCLAGLFVWAGTVSPDPSANHYPANAEVGPEPDAYVGQQVELGGTVVETDPAVLRIQYGVGEQRHVTLAGLEEPVAEGQQVSAYGTMREGATLEVENALERSPWETRYMYLVSFVGGLWVLGRIARHWRPDRDRLALVPGGDHGG